MAWEVVEAVKHKLKGSKIAELRGIERDITCTR
jgi:hypothetical protein